MVQEHCADSPWLATNSRYHLALAWYHLGEHRRIASDLGPWLAEARERNDALGFALLTVGARLIPAAQVGLITLLEVVLGPVWVWLALDERQESGRIARVNRQTGELTGDSSIARGALDAIDARIARQPPAQRVLARPRADHQNLHLKDCKGRTYRLSAKAERV